MDIVQKANDCKYQYRDNALEKVLFSSLGRDTGYLNWGFSWFFSAPPEISGIIPRLCHDCFFQILSGSMFIYSPANLGTLSISK